MTSSLWVSSRPASLLELGVSLGVGEVGDGFLKLATGVVLPPPPRDVDTGS